MSAQLLHALPAVADAAMLLCCPPVAYSIACEAPWLLGWVIWLLYLFRPGAALSRQQRHTVLGMALKPVSTDQHLLTNTTSPA